MIFKKIKPITPGQRQLLRLTNENLNKKSLLKKEIKGKKNINGRNHSGKITIFHRGGGAKKKYRTIKFLRNFNSTGIVCSIEYDPNRNAFIASIFDFLSNNFYYILAPKNLKTGDIIKSGVEIEPSLGSSLPLSEIPIGSFIYNISTQVNKKAQLSRAAGTFATIKEKTEKSAVVELSSGEQKIISLKCFASIGEVSNGLHFLTRLGKAGHSRWLNKRPIVRGVAMNPIDHPHGGGEGKKSGKSLTPWGKPNKRGKTSKNIKNLN